MAPRKIFRTQFFCKKKKVFYSAYSLHDFDTIKLLDESPKSSSLLFLFSSLALDMALSQNMNS